MKLILLCHFCLTFCLFVGASNINLPLTEKQVLKLQERFVNKQDNNAGFLLYQHYTCLQKTKAANNYFKVLINRNYHLAVKILARKYLNGENGIKQNIPRAIALFEKLKNTSLPSKYYLAELYFEGLVGKNFTDKEKGIKLYEELAIDGYPLAFRKLGLIAAKSGNDKDALNYYKKAALKGCLPVIPELINCYQKGLGCKKNPELVQSLVEIKKKKRSQQKQSLKKLFRSTEPPMRK